MTNFHKSTNNLSKVIEPELSYRVCGCFYNVYNKYGKGLKEKIYEKALAEELTKQTIKFDEQKRINIYSVDSKAILGFYIPDFIIENKIIVELKATEFLLRDFINQQRSYLRASIYEVAYIVNFGLSKIEIKRSICTNDRKSFVTQIKSSI